MLSAYIKATQLALCVKINFQTSMCNAIRYPYYNILEKTSAKV